MDEDLTPSYQDRLQLSNLQKLRDCKALEVEESNIGSLTIGVDPTDIVFEVSPVHHEVIFSPSLLKNELRYSHLSCFWRTPPNVPHLAGEFHLVSLYDALLGPVSGLTWEGSSKSEAKLNTQLRAIDWTPYSGAGVLTGIRLLANTDPLEIWHTDPRIGPVRLDIDYGEYLSAILKTKGVFGWQYLYADIKMVGYEFDHYLEGISRMLETFPSIFPDHNYSELFQRFEDRR